MRQNLPTPNLIAIPLATTRRSEMIHVVAVSRSVDNRINIFHAAESPSILCKYNEYR